ncbi:MAG: anti-sigma factor [Rhodospirillales bacterium]|nr:anti-sigma factor [Rhodospirillales bacterium]
MNCDEVLNLMDPLVDQELSDKDESAVKLHLDGCPDCQHELRQISELRETLKRTPRHVHAETLEGDVRERIGGAANLPAHHPFWGKWVKPALSHAMAASVGAILIYGATQYSQAPDLAAQEIVTAHVRSLMDRRLTQVASSDTHTVGPWFAGKIDYAPGAIDLNEDGFPLLGGRVDYLQERNVAALVYLRRKHRINLFVLPKTGKTPEKLVQWSRNGYNIVGKPHKDFMYWAISDLNPKELEDFSRLVTSK